MYITVYLFCIVLTNNMITRYVFIYIYQTKQKIYWQRRQRPTISRFERFICVFFGTNGTEKIFFWYKITRTNATDYCRNSNKTSFILLWGSFLRLEIRVRRIAIKSVCEIYTHSMCTATFHSMRQNKKK